MGTFSDNLETRTAQRGLYCVWVPAGRGEATRLVAHWIDPRAELREPPANDDTGNEAGELCLGTSLQFA